LPGGLPVDPSVILGVAGTVLAFALFVCTAMIYACLKFLGEWHTPLTVINYVLLGGASGFTLAAAFATPSRRRIWSVFWRVGQRSSPLRRASSHVVAHRWYRNCPAETEVDAANGYRRQASAKIVQKAQGSMGGSFNTREFFHRQPVALLRGDEMVFPDCRISCFRWLLLAVRYAGRVALVLGDGLSRAIPWPSRRTLVLFRPGQSSAKPVLPVDRLMAPY
jgi:hypothetical protein